MRRYLKAIAAAMSVVMIAAFAYTPQTASAADAPVLYPGISAPSSGNVFVGVPGSYESYSAADVLNRINAIRKEAYNQKLTGSYVPIKWSDSLEYIAQIRSAEASVKEDHVRPKGGYVFNMSVNGVSSYAENLAWGAGAMRAIELWYSEKKDLVNHTGGETGHYESLIDPDYTHIGMGSFKADGTWNCVCAEFTTESGITETRTGISGKCVQMIEAPKRAVAMYISGSSTVSPGGSSAYNAYAKYNGYSGLRLPDVIWSAAPEDVAYISENGTVDALANGTAVITAISGDLRATKTVTVETPKSSTTLKLSNTTFTYNGKVQQPAVTCDSDGAITIPSSILPGTYTVKAAATENYKAATAKYTIKVRETKIKSLKPAKKAFTVRVAKQPKANVTGYQVRYSTKSSMKNAKTVRIGASYSKTTKTIKKLKKKKKYYVQVRSYVKNGTTYYSAWSKVKTVKTK